MKYAAALCLLYLTTFAAYGVTTPKDPHLSPADAAKFKFYDTRSSFYQSAIPDSAIYYAEKGLKLSRHLHYRLGEGRMLDRFARINEQYGNLELALRYEKEALNVFKSIHDTAATPAAANLGVLEAHHGNFFEGEQLINTALAQYQKKQDTTGMIGTYTKLGELYELSGNNTKALQAYSKAELLNKGRPLSDEYFELISNLGGLHSRMGNRQQAASYYESGIRKSGDGHHAKAHIAFLNKAGKTWNMLGDKARALSYHQEGLQKARKFGLHEEEARSLMGIANALQSQDAEMSIQHLKTALEIARSIGHKQLAAEIYRSLSDIYRQQFRYQEALSALEEHHRLLDSLLNVNKGHKIADLQNSYELAESKLHIEALELANKEKTFERNEGLIAALAILIILVVLVGYFYKTSKLNKRLAATNLIKDKLFSIIGHDLRNPIGGITQLLAILEEDEMDPEHQRILSEMRLQGDVTLDILNALLKWGETQLKGVHTHSTTFNAKISVAKNITALGKQAADKVIIIDNRLSPDLMLYGDINHFEYIIRNLLSNAIKFSYASGTIEVEAMATPGSNQITFLVKDHGKGISKNQQELFFNASLDVSFGTSGEKGTGIGLMLCKEFVAADNGRIWLESEEGKGASFYFTFGKQAP